jgi:hypothetical protein
MVRLNLFPISLIHFDVFFVFLGFENRGGEQRFDVIDGDEQIQVSIRATKASQSRSVMNDLNFTGHGPRQGCDR